MIAARILSALERIAFCEWAESWPAIALMWAGVIALAAGWL